MRFERLILALGTLSVASIGSAAMALDPIDAIGVCARISKKDARLECYDQVARDATSGRLQSSTPAPQAAAPGNWTTPPIGGAQVAQPRPQAQSQAPAGFGAEQVRRTEAERREDGTPDSVSARVASSADNGLGMWRMRLADGAVWQMTERVANFRPPAPNEAVTIRKGALGGFLMDVGKQSSVRVRRVN
jgi:hypothetical protein